MLYKAEIVAPVNTPVDIALGRPTQAVPVRVRVFPGVVKRVWIGFPKGCFGLAHLQIWHWGWPVWPWNPQQSFHWNDYMFSFADRYPLTDEPYEFVLKAWSFDDFYPHTLTFAVLVDPAPAAGELEGLQRTLLELGLLGGA